MRKSSEVTSWVLQSRVRNNKGVVRTDDGVYSALAMAFRFSFSVFWPGEWPGDDELKPSM